MVEGGRRGDGGMEGVGREGHDHDHDHSQRTGGEFIVPFPLKRVRGRREGGGRRMGWLRVECGMMGGMDLSRDPYLDSILPQRQTLLTYLAPLTNISFFLKCDFHCPRL